MQALAEVVFWVCAGSVVYLYAGFPVVMAMLARWFARPVKKAAIEPSVSILTAAYNEEGVIADKIRNSLELDYPAEKLEIVVAADGCRDGTVAAARKAVEAEGAGERVRILEWKQNRGKLAVLNDAVPQLRGEIVVFSDAASMLAPDAVRKLVENFGDPEVGAAGGLYRVRKPEESAIGVQEDFYWKYESFLKDRESRVWSMLGAHGSLYAIRRALYPQLEQGTINDDYVIPIRIAQRGYRAVYETGALSWEWAREMDGFQRRIRIMRGNFQQLSELKGFLWPPRWLMLFFLLSHKAGRVIVPFGQVGAVVANLFLLGNPLYRWLGAGQLLFYGLAAAHAVMPLPGKLLRLPYYFTMINMAAFAGIWQELRTGRVAWKR